MSNYITISREDILKLLEESFERGYGGYLELKEDCVNSILSNYVRDFRKLAISNPPYHNMPIPNFGGSQIASREYSSSFMPPINSNLNNLNLSNINLNSITNTTTVTNSSTETTRNNAEGSGQITLTFNY
jgi:hypothetical protein